MDPKVIIVILNWNRQDDTLRCLESLYQSSYESYDVILVDNFSQDESLVRIREWAAGKIKTEQKFSQYNPYNKPIEISEFFKYEVEENLEIDDFRFEKRLFIIKNDKNYGFAEGNNIGIKFALKAKNLKYIMLLNNDIEIASACLMELIKVAELQEEVGSCQPKMLSYADPCIIDAVGVRIGKDGGANQMGYMEKDLGQYEKVREVFGTCAGASLYRKQMFIKIGLFDEDFFAYYEDVDFLLRSRLMGWKAMYIPRAIVYHKGSATLGQDSPTKVYFLERNKYYYLIKNLPRKIMLKFLILRPAAIIAKILLALFKKNSLAMIKSYVFGNLDAIKNIPKLFIKRKSIRSLQIIQESELISWFK